MQLKILTAILILFLTLESVRSQNPVPDSILNKLKAQIERVHDYKAEIDIEVDVDFINIPQKHATIIFKQPDKVKFKSEGFFMIPKKGLRMPVKEILDQPYSAIYVGNEKIEGRMQHEIKIVPLTKKPEIILATWWIDKETYLLTKTESTTRDQGTFEVNFTYDDPEIPLPTKMVISFEIENINLPLKFIGRAQGMEIDESKRKPGEPYKGNVIIRFSDYEINMNPSDEVFDEED